MLISRIWSNPKSSTFRNLLSNLVYYRFVIVHLLIMIKTDQLLFTSKQLGIIHSHIILSK